MPRPQPPVPSTLRNRNRITNKSRLRVHIGNVEADPIIPDEDDEKNRMLQSVAGVDQEDANEHHLQQVLSEAALRHQSSVRATRGASDKITSVAYIPTPDSTGIVDNYETLYPSNKWRDPASYVFSSETVEEKCQMGLAHGCTYYMDERDKEWLDKNNEEARGEGTSTQASLSAGTRTSARSAKSKGKEPDTTTPVHVGEDHFELVMGLFELITHEETEYLHHSLKEGMTFPEFSNYHDTFANPLPASLFAKFAVPRGIPPPPQLLRMARLIYPYWRERRIERGGQRIIPQLNGDETDTLNESYICFRRREVKAVRKTRASQANSSDKLTALNKQLSEPLEIAKNIVKREYTKCELGRLGLNVWQRRIAIVDLKRRNPSLDGDVSNEELLVDKEPPAKRLDLRTRLPVKPEVVIPSPPIRTEPSIRPKDRFAAIHAKVENALQKRKEKDYQWEDSIDNSYVPPFVSFPSRVFKHVGPSDAPKWPAASSSTLPESNANSTQLRQPRPVRLRYGRGGRMHLDRGNTLIGLVPRRGSPTNLDAMDIDVDNNEQMKRLQERWRFDSDDAPSIGISSPDEQDRHLVDDYNLKYIRHSIHLLADVDQNLLTDPSITKYNSDGRKEVVIPFKLGHANPIVRRDMGPRPGPQPMISHAAQQAQAVAAAQHGTAMPMPNGTPISAQQQVKMSSAGLSHLRISSSSMRTGSVIPNGMHSASPPLSSPSSALQLSPPLSATNGVARAAINMPHLDAVKIESGYSIPNGAAAIPQSSPSPHSQEVMSHVQEVNVNGQGNFTKSQEPFHILHPGYHINGFQGTPLSNHSQYMNVQTGLSAQQMQNLKSVFAAPGNQDMTAVQINGVRPIPGPYMHVVQPNVNYNSANISNMKLPAVRQPMQWSHGVNGSPMLRPTSIANGLDVTMINGSLSPNLAQATPVRTPSANGTRMGLPRNMLSPHARHGSPSPVPSISLTQSPPRLPSTPTMAAAQPVGATQGSY
ncbi:enhancer of polycomb-like-domain-containing protein [Desarmillaria tabescens]|uniref:Enhancer of polycomb-like protein n=1 Tax=Armillaria tabescens TaxID=1929756 RepID=A0AA39NE05_ARMTA|nr:enhancer of polycomb-like-domain-containing protein [Desarmillaria tabescens]KAK0463915.1 enhancer of polycomb-like-domain-containing protein [Desarmillaria tabescens]